MGWSNLEIDVVLAVIAIDFGISKIIAFIGSTSFDPVIDVIANDIRRLYFVVAG